MSGMRWHRVSSGHAASAAGSQNLSCAVQEMQRQGAHSRGRQLRRPYFGCPRPKAFQWVGSGTSSPVAGSIQSSVSGRQIATPSQTVCPWTTRRTVTSRPSLGVLVIGRQFVITGSVYANTIGFKLVPRENRPMPIRGPLLKAMGPLRERRMERGQ
jgi:hypothetical protein